eukprot:scaffold188440_cov20-Tisochrysis_lutea.AAC.1
MNSEGMMGMIHGGYDSWVHQEASNGHSQWRARVGSGVGCDWTWQLINRDAVNQIGEDSQKQWQAMNRGRMLGVIGL